jgi:hypothetical protein
MTCRKETGSPFMAFCVWNRSQVSVTGETRSWINTTDRRHFCPACGSSLFGTYDTDEEVEVRLGCFDEVPTDLVPEYELWTPRREHWLPPIEGTAQHGGNRR